MIKKLLCSGLLFAGLVSVNAQENFAEKAPDYMKELDQKAGSQNMLLKGAAATQTVNHFAYYFIDKHSYKASTPNTFPVYSSPSAYTFNEFGSSFLNPNNEQVTIYTAYVFAGIRTNSAAPTPSAIPLVVTIYSADVLGTPGASIATSTCVTTYTNGIGFSGASFSSNPVVVNGAFFIAVKAAPTASTDTAWIGHARGSLPSATVALNDRFSDTLGWVRQGANFVSFSYSTTGFAPEPIIVPELAYTFAVANASTTTAPNSTATPGAYCAGTTLNYINNTTGLVLNKQYNYNAFAAKWKPYQTTSYTYTPVSEPVLNWSFSGAPTPTATYTTNIVTHTYSVVTTNTVANISLIVKYQSDRVTSTKVQDIKTWTVGVVNCTAIGFEENSPYASVSVYPNPAISGKTNITGLHGINTITVYNLTGQVIFRETSERENVTVDLSGYAAGAYLIKLNNTYGNSKLTRVIKE
jgi:hypothetical protein